MAGGSISLTGVDQSNPVELPFSGANGNNGTPSVTVTTVNDNAWVVDSIANRSGAGGNAVTATAGAGQTGWWNANNGNSTNNGVRGAGSYEGPKTPAGAVPMTWTLSSSQDWAIGAVAVKPAGGVTLVTWEEVVN
jgi:hypothetical protein